MLVLPFPVELLRFLEQATPPPSGPQDTAVTTPSAPAAVPNSETPKVDSHRFPTTLAVSDSTASKVSHSG
jgi:hypothetical protein